MNSVILLSFEEWLSTNKENLDEATVARFRTKAEDLPQADAVLTSIQPNDIIDLGRETQHKGQPVPKYAQVIGSEGSRIKAKSLATGDIVFLSPDQLFEVDPSEMPHAHLQQMKALGANRLWQRRTNRQRTMDERQKAKQQQARQAMQAHLPSSPEVSQADIARIKKILMSGDEEPSNPSSPAVDPLKSLFSQPPEQQTKKPAPLAGFRKFRDQEPLMNRIVSRGA